MTQLPTAQPLLGPRNHTPYPGHLTAHLPSCGLPGDRSARSAARNAFVALKRSYLQALDGVASVDWLRGQIVTAEEPVDLWLLRAPVFAALNGTDADQRIRRQMLRRGLEAMFLDGDGPASGFTPF